MSTTPFRTVELSDPRFEPEGLRCVTVKSRALAQRADLTLHVPPESAKVVDAPLVILLHGVYGSHWAWALKGAAHRTNASLQREENLPPFVLAMPSDGLWGDGSGYLPHRTQDFECWIVSEVPLAVMRATSSVTAKSPVFIAGLSMGGFGALRIAGKYPGKFRAASAHSAVTEFGQLKHFVKESLATFTALDEDRSVLDTLLRNRSRLPPLHFDCGLDDPLIGANRALHTALEAAGIAHTYEEFPGGHEWPYWEKHFAHTLRFFATTLNSPR